MAAKPGKRLNGLRKDALATGPGLEDSAGATVRRPSGPERIRLPNHGAGTRSAKFFERVLLLWGRKPSASNTLPRPQEAGVQNFATPRSPRSKVQSMGAKGFVAGVHATIGEVGLANRGTDWQRWSCQAGSCGHSLHGLHTQWLFWDAAGSGARIVGSAPVQINPEWHRIHNRMKYPFRLRIAQRNPFEAYERNSTTARAFDLQRAASSLGPFRTSLLQSRAAVQKSHCDDNVTWLWKRLIEAAGNR
jgi:hypothetical protein